MTPTTSSRNAIFLGILLLTPSAIFATAAAPAGAPIAFDPPYVNATANLAAFDVALTFADAHYGNLDIVLPAGARVLADPTYVTTDAFPAWRLTGRNTSGNPQSFEFSRFVPLSATGATTPTFRFRLTDMPCPSGLADLTWSATGRNLTQVVSTYAPTLRCDTIPPQFHDVSGNRTAGSSDGTISLFANVTDATTPVTILLALTLPNGTRLNLTSAEGRFAVPLNATALGTWTYHFRATDGAGNRATTPNYTVEVLDTTPPTLSVPSIPRPEAGYTFNMTFVALDNAPTALATTATFHPDEGTPTPLAINGTSVTITLPYGTRAAANVTFTATDGANLTTTHTERIVPVDTQAPTMTTASPGPISGVASDFTITATDAGTQNVTIQLEHAILRPDGTTLTSVTSGNATHTVRLEETGTHTLRYNASDDLGHTTPTPAVTLIVDLDTPTATFENATGTANWATAPVTLTFYAPDPLSGWRDHPTWHLDDVHQTDRTALVTTDGIHTLRWNGTSVGNHTGHGTDLLRIDQTPPTLTHTLAGDGGPTAYRGNVTLTASASDVLSGLALLEYQLGSADWVNYTAPVLVTADGPHTLGVRATDDAGLTTTRTLAFLIDREAPTVTLRPTGENVTGPVFNERVTLDANADNDEISCTLDGAAIPLPHTVTTPGAHTFACTGTDAAGNTATASLDLIVDADAPTLTPLSNLGAIATAPGLVSATDNATVAAVTLRYTDASGTATHLEATPTTTGWSATPMLADGDWTLHARATDAFGHATGWVEMARFTLVQSLGDATLNVPAGTQPWRNTPLNITWTLPAGRDVVMVFTRDGNDTTLTHDHLVVSDEGATTLTFRPRDRLGNEGTPMTLTVRIDTLAPTLTVPAAFASTGAGRATWNATDAGSGIATIEAWLTLAGGTRRDLAATTTGADYANLPEGNHTLHVRATDAAGNAAPEATTYLHIDLTDPTATLTLPSTWTNETSPRFAIAAHDAGSGPAQVTLRAVNATGAITALDLAIDATTASLPLTEGDHVLTLHVTDKSGRATTSAPATLRVDRTAPDLATPLVDARTNASAYERALTLADDGSSPARAEASLDGGAYTPATTLRLTDEGVHTVRVRTLDDAGNVGPTHEARITIDRTGPAATLADTASDAENGTLAWSATDALSPIASVEAELTLADGTRAPLDANLTRGHYASLPEGIHTIRIRFTDAAGNTGPWAPAKLAIDHTAPTVTLGNVPAYAGDTLRIRAHATDTHSGIAAIELTLEPLDGTANTTERVTGGSADVTFPLTRSARIHAVAIDGAGHRSAPTTSATITHDADAPTLSVNFDGTRTPTGDYQEPFFLRFSATDAHDPAPRLEILRCTLGCPWLDASVGVAQFGPHSHVVTLRATDHVGRVAEHTVTFTVAAPPSPSPPATPTPTPQPTGEPETPTPAPEPTPEPQPTPAPEQPEPTPQLGDPGTPRDVVIDGLPENGGAPATRLRFLPVGPVPLESVSYAIDNGTRTPIEGRVLPLDGLANATGVLRIDYAWSDGLVTSDYVLLPLVEDEDDIAEPASIDEPLEETSRAGTVSAAESAQPPRTRAWLWVLLATGIVGGGWLLVAFIRR